MRRRIKRRYGFVSEVGDNGRVEMPEAFRILHGVKDGLYELRVEGDSITLTPIPGLTIDPLDAPSLERPE